MDFFSLVYTIDILSVILCIEYLFLSYHVAVTDRNSYITCFFILSVTAQFSLYRKASNLILDFG